MNKPKTVDEYISAFDGEVKVRLEHVRKLIKNEITGVEEVISYGMPAYKLNDKIVVYFSGYEKHVGIYPGKIQDYSFSKTLQKYASGKSTLKFPNDEPLPDDVIREFIRFRLKELGV